MLGQPSSARRPAVCDPDLADLNHPITSLDRLVSYRYQVGANQAAQHPVCEAVSKHQRLSGATLLNEQLKRPARFIAETTFARWCRHLWPPIDHLDSRGRNKTPVLLGVLSRGPRPRAGVPMRRTARGKHKAGAIRHSVG